MDGDPAAVGGLGADVQARPEAGAVARATRPLWQHVLALALLLAVLATYTGTRSAFVTDESFVVIQLDRLDATGRWTLPHPIPEVDPEGAAFPLHNATRYDSGFTLYGKHPLLVYLYLPVHRVAGLAGLIGLSVLGTVVAAGLAGLIARRVRAGAGPLAVWLVGAASPLLFDAFLIHAHTLAAALAALATYLALRAIEDRRLVFGAGAAVALYATALLRTEGVLLAGALGAAVAAWSVGRRRLDLLPTAALAVGAGAAAFLTDRWWAPVVADGSPAPASSFGGTVESFVSSRATSLAITTIKPGYGDLTPGMLAAIVGALVLIVGVVLLRRHPDDPAARLLPAAGAAALAIRAALGWGPVPGLLLAFCVGVVGLVLLRGPVWRSPVTRFVLLAMGGFVLAVALTQYRAGGHTEWGGRYFALALPGLGAVAAASLAQAFSSLPRPQARVLQASLLVAALGLGGLAVRTVHEARARNDRRTDAVLAAAAALPRAGDGGAPVVVTEDEQIPRLARGRYDEVRFLHVPRPFLPIYLERLAEAGFDDLLLVAVDPAASLEEVPTAYGLQGRVEPHSLQWDEGGGLIRLRRSDEARNG